MVEKQQVRDDFYEPACWGSAELPLIPVRLAQVLKGVPVLGLVKVNKDRSKTAMPVDLSSFASDAWRGRTRKLQTVDGDKTVLDKVVEAVSSVYATWPDQLDLPVLAVPLDRFDGAGGLPFERATWQALVDCGAPNDLDIALLLTGTFREMVERLGDVRASLDFAVTGQAWILQNAHGRYGFETPAIPDSPVEAAFMLRLRTFRCRGISFATTSYTVDTADFLGFRWGVGQSTRHTLDEVGKMMGLTRERVRQLEKQSMWSPAIRVWGRPPILEECHRQLLEDDSSDVVIVEPEEHWSRQDAIALLVDYGYPEEDFVPPWTVEDELAELGIKTHEIRQFAYRETERVGFITRHELQHHLLNRYPQLEGDTLGEVISWLIVLDDLPYGYVYVEGSHGSRIKLGLERLLATFGPLPLDEACAAVQRGLRMRQSRFVFPPHKVIERFVEESSEFWLEDKIVGLRKPIRHELTGVEKWVLETINACTGRVIHRTELWDKARAAGMRNGTLSVYSMYSRYFKPVGRGCVAVTGHQPSDRMIDLAVNRAKAIRIRTRKLRTVIEDGVVVLDVEVGNEMVDSGLLLGGVELQSMLGARRYKAMRGGEQYGHIAWSGTTMTGFATVLQELKAQPGDQVRLRFDLANDDVDIDLADE
jgi:hypothetical protein